MKRTCSCGRPFRSLNPFSSLCGVCAKEQEGTVAVLLGRAENELEANIWRDVLAQEGIGSATRQTDPLSARWQMTPSPFSVEVLVLAKDLNRARELIDTATTGDAPRRVHRRRP